VSWIDDPRPCPYLPEQRASLENILDLSLTPESFAELLPRGYRRFGCHVFRPACSNCRACLSLRVLVNEFQLSAGDRRVIRQNRHIRCELAPATVTRQHLDLYNRYQAFMHLERGWEPQSHTVSSYVMSFLRGPQSIGLEWRYLDGDRLVGVALMDSVPGAISLVYFFYDPAWRPHSPGRFSILNQLLFAQQRALPHAYLGYCVAACRSLSYKSRFRPHEILERYVPANQEPIWTRVPDLR
jgi:arginyl-tRNA--protein-N-Asp/Glu arginylyltransferase